MKRRLLAVVAGVMLVVAGTVQTAELQQGVVYVTYSPHEDNDEETVNEFFDLISSNLKNQGLSLDVVNPIDRKPDPRSPISIGFNSQLGLLIMHLWQPIISQISPILTEPQIVQFTLQPLSASSDMATAVLLYTYRRCELAEPYWEQAIGSASAWYDILYVPHFQGNCSLLNGDYEAAINYYESVETLANVDKPKTINLAWSYLQVGNEVKAFEIMDYLVEFDYNDKDENELSIHIRALANRSQLYALVFRYNDAIADMDTAIALDPNNPELHTVRGQMYLLLYEWDKVLADYNKAIELDPNYADTYFYRGVLFYTQGPRENALADFERYLELAPDGDHTEEAANYVESIRAELEALDS